MMFQISVLPCIEKNPITQRSGFYPDVSLFGICQPGHFDLAQRTFDIVNLVIFSANRCWTDIEEFLDHPFIIHLVHHLWIDQ